jgi:hypothetical protein
LKLALISAGMAAEHIQNEGRAVYDLNGKERFQVPLLSGSEFVVKDD